MDFKPTDAATLVDSCLAIFDGVANPEQKLALVSACEKAGGVKALDNKDQAANLFTQMSRVLFAIPDYQLC